MSTIPISQPNHDETPFSRDESAVWRYEIQFEMIAFYLSIIIFFLTL